MRNANAGYRRGGYRWIGLALGLSILIAATVDADAPATAPATAPARGAATAAATGPATMGAPIPAPAAGIPPDLAVAMQGAIRSLQNNDAKAVVFLLVDPAEFQQHANGQTMNDLATQFAASEKPAQLLSALRQAIVLPPVVAADGQTVTFTLTGHGDPRPMEFEKRGEHWYLHG